MRLSRSHSNARHPSAVHSRARVRCRHPAAPSRDRRRPDPERRRHLATPNGAELRPSSATCRVRRRAGRRSCCSRSPAARRHLEGIHRLPGGVSQQPRRGLPGGLGHRGRRWRSAANLVATSRPRRLAGVSLPRRRADLGPSRGLPRRADAADAVAPRRLFGLRARAGTVRVGRQVMPRQLLERRVSGGPRAGVAPWRILQRGAGVRPPSPTLLGRRGPFEHPSGAPPITSMSLME